MEHENSNSDSRNWLYERLSESKQRNPNTSLRAFAKRIGVSPSTVSEILSGKRHITPKLALRISQHLDLTPIATQALRRSAALTKLRSAVPDDEEINRVTDSYFKPLDFEAFKLMSNWYHFGILSLSEVEGNRYSASWIAERLGITAREAKDALAVLEKLKLVRRRGNGFEQVVKPLSIETKGYESAIRIFLQQNLQLASDALETVPAELREINTTILAINPDKIEKARPLIKRFRRELADILEKGKRTRVYNLSFQLFPVDKTGSLKSRKNGVKRHGI